MRGFLLLLRRDLVQRAPIFVASLAMGLFILFLPLLPGSRIPPGELRGATSLSVAFAWGTILALLLGGSILTRDLTEHRLGFDFRLPVRPATLWAARLFAALATMALAAALVLAPSAIAGMDLEWGPEGRETLLLALLALVALLLLANPVALASRTRKSWAGLDMISFALVGSATYWSWQTLLPWESPTALRWTTTVLVVAILVGTAAASLLQVVRGRTEADKAQRCLSIGLLTTALLAAGTGTGYSQWLVHPTLQDLVGNTTTSQSLGPDWVVIAGLTQPTHQMVARFLYAPATGQSLLLGPGSERTWWLDSVSSSVDGSTLAWLESAERDSSSYRVLRLSTTESHARPGLSPVTLSNSSTRWALSTDGSSIASLEAVGRDGEQMRLVVSNLASGDVAAAIQLRSCRVFGDMLFLSAAEVVIPCGVPTYSDADEATWFLRIDLATKEARTQSYRPERPPQIDASLGLLQSPRGWLYLRENQADGLTAGWEVLQTETGPSVATLELSVPTPQPGARGRQLHDGTFVIAMVDSSGSHLLHYSVGGELQGSIDLPKGTPRILAESSDSKAVLTATVEQISPGPPRESFTLVDLQTRTAKAMPASLHLQEWLGLVGSAHSVFLDKGGRHVWFNPETKSLQPLLGEAQYLKAGLPSANHY